MKIAVYAIALNEAEFVRRCIESALDADYFILADTGSTDLTPYIATECGATSYSISIQPWRFDHARNAALALVPADVDVCIALDLDEVLEPGWRQEIEANWNEDTTRMRYQYDWGSGIVFHSDKIHARNGYHWKHPCHEVLMPDLRIEERFVSTNKQLVTHLPDNNKSRGQYMGLLELAHKEEPFDPRTALYYGRELIFSSRQSEAIHALFHYLDLPGDPQERAYAMRLIARAQKEQGDNAAALQTLRKACAEYPGIRENWVHLSEVCNILQLWNESFSAIEYALAIKDRPVVYTSEPLCWGSLPYDLGAVALWHLDMRDKGRQYLLKAIELDPNETRLKDNLAFFGEEE